MRVRDILIEIKKIWMKTRQALVIKSGFLEKHGRG